MLSTHWKNSYKLLILWQNHISMSFLVLIENYKAGELKLLMAVRARECCHITLLDLVATLAVVQCCYRTEVVSWTIFGLVRREQTCQQQPSFILACHQVTRRITLTLISSGWYHLQAVIKEFRAATQSAEVSKTDSLNNILLRDTYLLICELRRVTSNTLCLIVSFLLWDQTFCHFARAPLLGLQQQTRLN